MYQINSELLKTLEEELKRLGESIKRAKSNVFQYLHYLKINRKLPEIFIYHKL